MGRNKQNLENREDINDLFRTLKQRKIRKIEKKCGGRNKKSWPTYLPLTKTAKKGRTFHSLTGSLVHSLRHRSWDKRVFSDQAIKYLTSSRVPIKKSVVRNLFPNI